MTNFWGEENPTSHTPADLLYRNSVAQIELWTEASSFWSIFFFVTMNEPLRMEMVHTWTSLCELTHMQILMCEKFFKIIELKIYLNHQSIYLI